MSSELERRLEAMLCEAPEPDPGAGEEALHRALRALRPEAPPRRGLRTAALAFAAAVVLLVIAAGSLAAAGALHVSLGAKPEPPPSAPELTLPKGANGIAVIVNGRLSVVTRGGGRLQVPATAAALSPRALYVAVGSGDSLVAMAPDGRRAWSHPTAGKVVAIAWAPDGFRIAYVVHAGHRFVLHVIYGNGVHDTTIDRSVRPVRPSWRADSLAFAYVGGGGKAVVYDLGHTSHRIVRTAARDVTSLAFALRGRALALGARSAIWLGRARIIPGANAGFGWLGSDLLAVANRAAVAPVPVGILPTYRPLRLGGPVVALAAGGKRFVAVVAGRSPRIVAGTKSHVQTVLALPPHTRVDDVAIG